MDNGTRGYEMKWFQAVSSGGPWHKQWWTSEF